MHSEDGPGRTIEGPGYTIHIPAEIDDGFATIELFGGERGCYFRIVSISFTPFRQLDELNAGDFDECLDGALCFYGEDVSLPSYCIRDLGFLTYTWRTAVDEGQANVETHSGRMKTEMRFREGMMHIRATVDGRTFEFIEPAERFRQRFRDGVLAKVRALLEPLNADVAQMVCDYVGEP